MPILTRRPQGPSRIQTRSARNSTDSTDSMKEPLWVVDDDDNDDDEEKPQKEMDLAAASFGNMLHAKKSRANLRIETYTPSDLHDRYLSSEEEPSPAPSEDAHPDAEVEPASLEVLEDECPELTDPDYKAEIVIAIPVVAYGRPKLIDITNLAPMHKRKRSTQSASLPPLDAIKPAVRAASATTTDENRPGEPKDLAHPTTTVDKKRPRLQRKANVSMPAPESWFPEDDPLTMAEDVQHFFPSLDIRLTPSYGDYEPFCLQPPNLGPSSHNASSSRPGGGRGSASHSPSSSSVKPTSSSSSSSSSLKGLGLGRAISKPPPGARGRREASDRPSSTKRPKAVTRRSSERDSIPPIPPFPAGEAVAVA